MARVLIITPYFWPDIAANIPLMTSLVTDLVNNGFDVEVITSYPGRNIDKNELDEFNKNAKEHTFYHGAKIDRLSNMFLGQRGSLAKLGEYTIFTVKVLHRLLWSSHFDVVFVGSNPPLINLPISYISRIKRIPLIYNLQDLFPDSAVDNGKLKNPNILRLLKKLERKSYKNTNLIITISDSFKDHVLDVAPNAKVTVIPNWVDTENIDYVSTEDNDLLHSTNLENRFIVLYAGNIGFAQSLETIIACAHDMKDYKEICFVIVGDGQNKEGIKKMVNDLGLDNVCFLPFQPEKKVPEVYSMADIGLVTMKKGTGHSSIPSKTWMIMACRRPVIACIDNDSDLAGIINETYSGIVVDPEDANSLKKAVLQMFHDRDLLARMGYNGRQYVEDNISRIAITAEYCNEFREQIL